VRLDVKLVLDGVLTFCVTAMVLLLWALYKMVLTLILIWMKTFVVLVPCASGVF
jgi:hypothetical protein